MQRLSGNKDTVNSLHPLGYTGPRPLKVTLVADDIRGAVHVSEEWRILRLAHGALKGLDFGSQ